MPISISSLIHALNYVSIHQCTDSNYGFKHKKRFETAIITVSNHYFLYGAGNRARTCDLRVTSALHYQLCYHGSLQHKNAINFMKVNYYFLLPLIQFHQASLRFHSNHLQPFEPFLCRIFFFCHKLFVKTFFLFLLYQVL